MGDRNYDNSNQLEKIEKWTKDPDSDGTAVLQMRATYTYDVFGNRIKKELDNNGDGTAETVEKYWYDGWKTGPQTVFVGMENWDVWADTNNDGVVQTAYVHGARVDQHEARFGSGSTNIRWLLQDHQLSVRTILDSAGVTKDVITYNAFGKIISETDSTETGNYTYTGREFARESGLQLNRRRWYDPDSHTFIHQDPIGFSAGDPNFYRYVHNSPTNATDPSGLFFDDLANRFVAVLPDAGVRAINDPMLLYRTWHDHDMALGDTYVPYFREARLALGDVDRYDARTYERSINTRLAVDRMMFGQVYGGWYQADAVPGLTAWADTVAGWFGVDTAAIRQLFGYDDVVDRSGMAWAYGEFAGEVTNAILTVVTIFGGGGGGGGGQFVRVGGGPLPNVAGGGILRGGGQFVRGPVGPGPVLPPGLPGGLGPVGLPRPPGVQARPNNNGGNANPPNQNPGVDRIGELKRQIDQLARRLNAAFQEGAQDVAFRLMLELQQARLHLLRLEGFMRRFRNINMNIN